MALLLSDLIDRRLMLFFDLSSKRDVLEVMSKAFFDHGKVYDLELLRTSLHAREKIAPTALTPFVAIPHVRLPSPHELFSVAIGIQKGKGIEWDSSGNSQVHLIFMVVGPDNRQSEYLAILSQITDRVKTRQKQYNFFEARCSEDIAHLVVE